MRVPNSTLYCEGCQSGVAVPLGAAVKMTFDRHSASGPVGHPDAPFSSNFGRPNARPWSPLLSPTHPVVGISRDSLGTLGGGEQNSFSATSLVRSDSSATRTPS